MRPKDLPAPSLKLLFFPAWDTEYVHFEAARELPFTPAPGQTSLHAWWLADAALLAYWPPEQVPATFARAGFIHTQFFSQGSTQCYVASKPDAAIVAFRGTEATHLEDALADAVAKLTPWDGPGLVHHGFLSALDAVWSPLSAHLVSLGARPVWFTGHSLGAALATLAAWRWLRQSGAPPPLYTIGSPTVGDKDFAREFDAAFPTDSVRYVNGVDGVTEVPPPPFYVHVGRAVHVGAAGSHHELFTGLRDGLIDHTPRRYTTLLWNTLVAGAS
jgi:triacylglycerol lipase